MEVLLSPSNPAKSLPSAKSSMFILPSHVCFFFLCQEKVHLFLTSFPPNPSFSGSLACSYRSLLPSQSILACGPLQGAGLSVFAHLPCHRSLVLTWFPGRFCSYSLQKSWRMFLKASSFSSIILPFLSAKPRIPPLQGVCIRLGCFPSCAVMNSDMAWSLFSKAPACPPRLPTSGLA